MGLRVGTNTASIAVQRQSSLSQRELEKTIKQLSSGTRFAEAGIDAAGFAISEHLRGQISGQKAAKFNSENAISLVQVAEGSLNEQHNILIRLRELSVQSASDTYSDEERSYIDKEYQQLISEFDRIAQTTQLGSQKLLAGSDSREMEFHVGAFSDSENIVKFRPDANTTSSEMGLSRLNVMSKSEARESLKDLDKAISKVASVRASFGAFQARMESVTNNNSVQVENLTAAQSRLSDVDVAEVFSRMTKAQVMEQFQISVLAQANAAPNYVLRLL